MPTLSNVLDVMFAAVSSCGDPATSGTSEASAGRKTAPKTNTAVTAYANAKADVDAHGALPVPAHLRNAATKLGKDLGWGKDYRYPHDYAGHYVREEYLPDAIRGHRYYEPSESGREKAIKERLAKLGDERLEKLREPPETKK